jgi:hypothetical protein
MKIRTIKLTSQSFLDKLQGKPSVTNVNLPSDIELLDLKFDLLTGQVVAIVRSDAFEDATESEPILELAPINTATQKASPIAAHKPEAKPVLAPKPEMASLRKPLVPPRPKPNSNMMEEEFSADQRKLLNFSVEGDFLIVKPVRFLKAEWDDINEVVRSIGGRWVKGDIISYWEIPLPKTE